MSDSLWFLDNLENPDLLLQRNTMAENQPADQDPVLDVNSLDGLSFDKEKSEDTLKKSTEGINTVDLTLDDSSNSSPDTTSLKTELEKSLLDLAKSTDNGENREIRITLNSDNINSISSGDISSLNGESNAKVETPKDQQSGVVINSSGKDNNNLGEAEQQANNDIQPFKPKIYVILRANKNGKTTEGTEKIQLNNPKSDTQYCEEIGSTVINIKDLFLPQEKQASGIGQTSAAASESSQESATDAKPKVELVITVKDERKKPLTSSPTLVTQEDDVARFKELLNSATSVSNVLAETLDSKLTRFNNNIRTTSQNIGYTSTSQSRWESATYLNNLNNRGQQPEEWSDETKDSYVRASDGAYCTRTVTTSPRGRKVQVHCYKDQRNYPSNQRVVRRAHHHDCYDCQQNFGSIWWEMDDQFNRIFRRFNRYMYF